MLLIFNAHNLVALFPVGVDFSPQMMCSISSSSGSSGSNSFGSQSQCKQQSLSGSSGTHANFHSII